MSIYIMFIFCFFISVNIYYIKRYLEVERKIINVFCFMIVVSV